MPKCYKPYHTLDNKNSFTYKQLLRLSNQVKMDVMEAWFRERYTDPANCCPYISAEGGYQYIWGGPYDAKELLSDEFIDEKLDLLVKKISDDLVGESAWWSPIPSDDDVKLDELYALERGVQEPYKVLTKSLDDIVSLVKLNIASKHKQLFYRLVYSNVIASLETYLADIFIFLVTGKGVFRDKYILFKKKEKNKLAKININDLQSSDRDKENRQHLTAGHSWHNLEKTENLFRMTLGFNFSTYTTELSECIDKRHDIVHRNGKNRVGKMIIIRKIEIRHCIALVKKLCRHVDKNVKRQINKPGAGK